MTIVPTELPSFDSFVKSTKASPRPTALPERCPTCIASDAIPVYEIVDLYRHDSANSLTSSLQRSYEFNKDKDSSTTCESSSSSTSSSSDEHEDCEMTDAETEMPPSRLCNGAKKKYLTEQQRYEIVCHVLSGEKQARVARDYGVTRAAVSYLVKHHNEIMHRVLMGHANYCCQRRAAAEANLMAQ